MKRKYALLLVAFIVLTSLCAVFLHHHEGGDPGLDCSVCHFVKQGVRTGILTFFALLILFERASIFPLSPPSPFSSVETTLHGRAPPSFSPTFSL